MFNFGAMGASLVLDIAQSEKGTDTAIQRRDSARGCGGESEHHRSILKLIGDIQRSGASLEEAKPDDVRPFWFTTKRCCAISVLFWCISTSA